jgi:hypothetical protein
MALAILELLDFDRANVRFKIDTGTNRYYQLKIGSNVERRHALDWVEEVFFTTPMSMNEAGGGLLNSSKEISIPGSRFGSGKAYVQLFSYKTAQGKSPAFSRVVRVPLGSGIPAGALPDLAPSLSMSTFMNTTDSFKTPRTIPCRTYGEVYSQQASLEDLLSGIIKIAAPAVMNLLGGAQTDTKKNGSSGAAGTNGNAGQADILALLLKTILGSVGGATGAAVSKQQSLGGPSVQDNRFLDAGHHNQFSRPFIFGIDDALLGTMIGPIIQVLPQLLNSVNQKRVQLKQADNKLVTDILSEVNRRMLLAQLLQAQHQTPASPQPDNGADLSQLIQLLQQAPAGQPATAAATPPTSPTPPTPSTPAPAAAIAQSFSLDARASAVLSSKAVVSFVTADAVPWNGMQKVLFTKSEGFQLKLRLSVAEPVPKTPLPKAILKIVFKDSADQSVLYEKTFKQKDVLPNNVMSFPCTQDELSHLPVNKNLAVLAEMRWLSSKTGKEYKALGSTEIVLVNKYFMKEQGKDVSPEQELTDMKRFRPFWNKIWESPSLNSGGKGDGEKKYIWELDVSAKYSVLLSAAHEANGLMETKIQRSPQDEDSVSEKTEGRMKAGIELSLTELNKLLPLWNDAPALDREKLEALSTDAFVKNNATEFVYNFKLKGKASERGMVWVVPIFKLFECTLNTVSKTDEAGQVTAMAEEKVRFPLPVSARVIGLKSQR